MRLGCLVLLILALNEASGFSPGVCKSICAASSVMCWLCESVHGSADGDPDSDEIKFGDYLDEYYDDIGGLGESVRLEKKLRPPTKAELIRKAKFTFSRQQKIVGGLQTDQGESPWTVR